MGSLPLEVLADFRGGSTSATSEVMRRLLSDLDILGLSRAAVCFNGLEAAIGRATALRFAGVGMSDRGEVDASCVDSSGVSGLFELRSRFLSKDEPAPGSVGVVGRSLPTTISDSWTAAWRFRSWSWSAWTPVQQPQDDSLGLGTGRGGSGLAPPRFRFDPSGSTQPTLNRVN